MSKNKKSIILLSGGLDSLTCLAVAKSRNEECYGLSFSYGQKHDCELIASQKIAKYYNIKHKVIENGFHDITYALPSKVGPFLVEQITDFSND